MTDKESNFFTLVENKANEQGCSFFLKNGEGRELKTSQYDGEDLYGWLIPTNLVEQFKKVYSNNVTEEWDDYLKFALWSLKENSLSIEFVTF